MKREMTIEISNLYGSGSCPREISVSRPKLTRTKKRSRTSSDIGIKVEQSTLEENTETSMEHVNSFKMENGKPVVRLGGAYGKLQGLLRDAGEILCDAGEPDFTKAGVRRIIPAIQILPEFPELEMNGTKMITENGLVTVNSSFGGNRTMKPTIWDIIPKATAKITLIYPDAFDAKVKKMLDMAQNLNFAERRRARMKIIK